MVVCKDRIDRIKASECMGVEAAVAVESEITALLSGKSYDHLATLQKQIQTKLASGEPIDTDYWEGLLKRLLVWKAKVYLFFGEKYDATNPYITGEVEEPARSRCSQST